MFKTGIDLYVSMAQYAIPIAVAFALCEFVVKKFMRLAFGKEY